MAENDQPFAACEECENDMWTDGTDEPWEPTKVPPRPRGIEVHAGYIHVGSIHDGVVTDIAFTFTLANKSQAQRLADDVNEYKPAP